MPRRRDRDRAAPRDRLRDPADRPLPAPDDRRQRGHRAAPAGLAGRAGHGALGGAARRSSGSIRRSTPSAIPSQLSGGERQRVGVARALGRGPADHAHGRAVRGGRSDRPRAAPGRVPAAPAGAGQDDPVRDPRHRRGDQDGRPRRRLAGRAAGSPSSGTPASCWPRPPRTSWPASSAPTAASSACRSAGSRDLELRPAVTARLGDAGRRGPPAGGWPTRSRTSCWSTPRIARSAGCPIRRDPRRRRR